MSAREGENVYVSKQDFKKYYPFFAGKYGYTTAYECMGLWNDPNVPWEAKYGLFTEHCKQFRYNFKANDGYGLLKDIIGNKDFFVYTSNTDGQFERSGFNTNSIYTPQGDFKYFQCRGKTGQEGPCRPDAVFSSEHDGYVDAAKFRDKDGNIPKDKFPKCLYCGGLTFNNVRGGDWYLHKKFDDQSVRFRQWLEKVLKDVKENKKNLCIIEIGAGFNTPTVTRLPMEAIQREVEKAANKSGESHLIRLNPTESFLPADLKFAVGIDQGWDALYGIRKWQQLLSKNEGKDSDVDVIKSINEAESKTLQSRADSAQSAQDNAMNKRMQMMFGSSFNWRRHLEQLAV
jgi:NAD-dependent SIR2 family protein deacetylase